MISQRLQIFLNMTLLFKNTIEICSDLKWLCCLPKASFKRRETRHVLM